MLTKQIMNKKFKKERNIYYWNFLKIFKLKIRIRTSKSGPVPDNSRPDPQHCFFVRNFSSWYDIIKF